MDEPKFESEKLLVQAARREKETRCLNWTSVPEGQVWTIDSFRGVRCSAMAFEDGSFVRLVQDPYARVNHG